MVKIAPALLLFAFSSVLFARPHDPAVTLPDVIRKVQQQQRDTKTLQADFRQEKTLALLAKPEVSTGRFSFERPDKVRWSYEQPKKMEVLVERGALTTFYPELGKAERLNVGGMQERIFRYLGASGAPLGDLENYFQLTFVDRADNPAWLLDMQPKPGPVARRVRHLRVWIDKQTYLTTKFEYTERDGDITTYEFTNIRRNVPLDPSLFVLNLPPSVKVEPMKLQ